MNISDQHKALLITVLFTGIILMGLFSLHLTRQNEQVAESFYEMVPETEEEKEERILEELASKLPKTNSAFNEDQEFKDMMKNFKSMNSNDFEKTTASIDENMAQDNDNDIITESANSRSSQSNYALKKQDKSSFEEIKKRLAKHTQETTGAGANANSTLTYSLKNRKLLAYNTPRYLCEISGKMVVNITVNHEGVVTDAYVNTTSTSSNECLIEHAIEYAKAVVFDSATTASQLGSITFYFKGKD